MKQLTPLTMTYLMWGGIDGTYSSGKNRAKNAWKDPLETTTLSIYVTLFPLESKMGLMKTQGLSEYLTLKETINI